MTAETELDLSVVIPCKDVASTLGEQLDALLAQQWDGRWEIVVVDNNSTDGTASVARDRAAGRIEIRVVSATKGQSISYARNTGIRAARADKIAVCDGDDVVQPGWVAAMGEALRAHRLISGIIDPSLLNPDWLATTRPLPKSGGLATFGPNPFVSGATFGVDKALWEEIGGFDEEFRGLEDIEFSLRALAHGITPVLVPEARVGYRYRAGLRALWRQGIFYGRGRLELDRRARRLGLAGLPRWSGTKSWLWLVRHLPDVRSRSGRHAWVWVLANRAGAARGLFDPRSTASPTQRREERLAHHPPPPFPLGPVGAVHGVLITFRRPDDLRRSLEQISAQTSRLDSLLVVDNDDDDRIRAIATSADVALTPTRYIGCAENMGPAGGIHAGITDVLQRAADEDVIVLFDDDDPPARADTLEDLQRVFERVVSSDPGCAGVGIWGAHLRRRLGRVRSSTSREPDAVAYLPGSACPHYSVAVLRRVGAPDPELFFGFDDLDLGLRIRDAGFRLYSSGLARDHGMTPMVHGRRVALASSPPTWRRYYSLRNLVIILLEHDETVGAVSMSLLAGVLKPLVNLPRRPRIAWGNLRSNVRALRDGWAGRAGKTIDPGGSQVAPAGPE
jgi:GT2 family glycosyltransferase